PLAPQDLFHPVRLRAGGVEPEADPPGALAVVAAVALDERLVVVGDAEVARVEEDGAIARAAAQLLGHRQGLGVRRDLHGRWIALEHDPLRADADREEALPLVLAEHLEAVDAPAQEDRPAMEQPEGPGNVLR